MVYKERPVAGWIFLGIIFLPFIIWISHALLAITAIVICWRFLKWSYN